MAQRDVHQLLEQRAAALAQRPTQETAVTAVEAVTVSVGGHRYALEARHIARILRTSQLCRLPDDGGDLLGLVVAGGAAVPVADLGSLLGLSGPDVTRPYLLLAGETDLPLGLLVDEVESFGRVVEMARRTPSETLHATVSEETGPVEHGVTHDGVVLLDVAALLSHPRALAVRTMRPGAPSAQIHHTRTTISGESCED